MHQNHVEYQARLDFVRNLLRERYHLEHLEISPIEYDPECPFAYNNFVYKVVRLPPITSEDAPTDKLDQAGCVPIAAGTNAFIMRLTNAAASGMDAANRVQNEVAIMNLVSAALNQVGMNVVPAIYGWGSAAHQQGWILQQLMPGKPLDAGMESTDLRGKSVIFAQMAKMLSAIQTYPLPESIEYFGGLTLDDEDLPISAAMSTVDAGPWTSYEESWRERLRVGLEKADANRFIKGWRANGVRERLEAFVENGVAAQCRSLASKDKKVLVHADFNGRANRSMFPQATNNILYEPTSMRITALLDYDFSCISHPSYEFLCSFNGHAGQFLGWSGDEDSEQLALHEAQLHGFPSPLPVSIKDGVDWEAAKVWEDELERAQVQRPRTMEGIDKVADIDATLQGITPWRVTNPDMMRIQSEEVIVNCRNEGEKNLMKMLQRLGF